MASKCSFKRSKRTRLCSGDLEDYIALQRRDLQPPPLGGGEAVMQFTLIKNVWALTETVSGANGGSHRFSGVNIEDITTHLFYIRYDADFFPLDSDNFFVLFRSRRYRIMRVTEHNENRLIIILQCKETGESSQDGSGS